MSQAEEEAEESKMNERRHICNLFDWRLIAMQFPIQSTNAHQYKTVPIPIITSY